MSAQIAPPTVPGPPEPLRQCLIQYGTPVTIPVVLAAQHPAHSPADSQEQYRPEPEQQYAYADEYAAECPDQPSAMLVPFP